MSSFISKASCRGNRPNNLVSYRYFQRNRLVSRLLRERGVARFVVAPYGYGKTGLALEYAETMFEFDDVFWVNCQSPCFIRDLDANDLVKGYVARDSSMRLVVFEDVPFLDAPRAKAFSDQIDVLLQHHVEVLVTCLPSCDVFGRLQQDRVRISATDLMLDDEEVSLMRDGGNSDMVDKAKWMVSCRVPMLVWSSRHNAPRVFLSHVLGEDVPSELRLAFVCVAVLGEGSFGDIAAFGHLDRELIERISEDYPHLGFSEDLDAFEGPSFDASDIAMATRGTIEGVVQASAYETREEFVHHLADLLVDIGKAGRGCDVVRALCPRKARASWIERNALRIVAGYCFLPLRHLIESLRSAGLSVSQRSLVALLESLCLRVLGDNEGACRHAKRYAFDRSTSNDVRAIALILLAQCGTASMKARASAELAVIAANIDLDGACPASRRWCVFLAQAHCLLESGVCELVAFWYRAKADGAEDFVLCIIAAWLYDQIEREMPENRGKIGLPPDVDCAAMERFVRDRINVPSSAELDYFSASAGLAMEAAHQKGMGYFDGPLPTAALIALRDIEVLLLTQRNRYEAESNQASIKTEDWLATHPDNGLNPRRATLKPVPRLSVPKLAIKTFGRLELRIGGELIDQERLKGRQLRSLVVLLAANQGRELSRDAICEAMWPNSPLSTSRKNFYTIWSQFRRLLLLPDGSCPYLIRHRNGCSFDGAYVQSDIVRLDEICREFLFEDMDYTNWSDLLLEIDRDFSSDLLPSETSNELILRTREDYRSKLVDALVAASVGFVAASNSRRGVWCARMALDHDDTREDAYVALMKAQIASGRRTAAMSTFRECRRVLAEKLGVDPAPETMQIYQQLLEAEGM